MTQILALILGIPILIYGLYLFVKKPWTGFLILLAMNYFLMGAGRYVHFPLPVSVIYEFFYIFEIIILFSNKEKFTEDGKIPASLFAIFGIWTLYCCVEIINDTCNLGIDIVAWFKDVRFYAFDPILCILIFSLVIRNKSDIKKLLTVIGFFIILAGIKCYWQKTFGFDAGENAWLEAGNKSTHIIYAGTLIRYFSFFTDAANYGSHSGIMSAIFGVLCLYEPSKNLKRKIFYALVTVCALYGMFLSGARSAMFVFLGTIIAYIFLSKNMKMFWITLAALFTFVGVLMFTDRGNGIESVRRMRSAFNLEDASVQVRDYNQEAISKYMSEAPLGIGLGRDQRNVPSYNRYRIVVETPPDSTMVFLWTHTGIIGISLFCLISILILLRCSIIVWFKIKDKELLTMSGLFTAAGAGWFFAGYANDIYFQYPNTFVIYGFLTIVFLSPYFDKKIQEEKELKALEDLEIQDVETIND